MAKAFILIALVAFGLRDSISEAQYVGKLIGKLSELHHGVSGEVYAVDGRTIHIKDFTYDGQGPAAYFYASTYKAPDNRGFRLRDENNNGDVIRRYRKEGVTLTLPEGKTLNNIKIFYVWCEEFTVNFGDVKIARNFDFPRPQKIDALKGVHSISSDNIVIVDAQTLLIPNLHYDGEAPDAKFWVGRGPKPSPQGLRVPDENGKEHPLRRIDGKTIVLTLPGDVTVFDIGHFGIWCEQFTVDFGHVQIPQSLNVPPSLKMLGISPQSKLNCEVLDAELAFEVRWAVAGESIVIQLVGKLDDREYMSFGLSGDVSKSIMIGGDVVVSWVDKNTLKGYAQDYYLADKSQCSGPSGSCPDTHFGENTNNVRLLNAALVNGYSIITYQRPLKASDQFDLPIYTNQSQAIIWAAGPLNQKDEVSFHTSYLQKDSLINFARPAKWNCPLPEGDVAVKQEVTAESVSELKVEELPSTTSTTSTSSAPSRIRDNGGQRRRGSTSRSTTTSRPVVNTDEIPQQNSRPTRNRGGTRNTQKTVPAPTPVKSKKDAWFIPPIECFEPEDGVFYAQMGPTGGKRGYPAITGHVGWGISWYINGLLIPEINVVRGKTYNFITEGGNDPEVSAKYHPFYITDDPVGGYAYKTSEERKNVTIFAGARFDKGDEIIPTGVGRLCHWTQTGNQEADDFDSFGAYQRTLQLKCDVGEPGVVTWTPDQNTPDTVYYQCFTHRHLGWKINVHDTCELAGAASEVHATILQPASSSSSDNLHNNPLESFKDQSDTEMETSASIREETRVKFNSFVTDKDILSDALLSDYSSTTTLTPSPLLLSHHHQTLRISPYSKISSSSSSSSFKPALIHDDDGRRLILTKNLFGNNTNKMVYFKKKVHHDLRRRKPTDFAAIKFPVNFSNLSIKNVELSPKAASTEREPSELIISTISTPVIKNTAGFDPQSVVIEKGFKPIIKNRQEENKLLKISDINLEIDPEGQSGVVQIKGAKKYKKNPIFFKDDDIIKLIIRPRSLIDSDIEPEMAAAERVESYYLPPPGKINSSDLKSSAVSSEIDFQAPSPPDDAAVKSSKTNKSISSSSSDLTSLIPSPPDVVVTFDGKTVSGASLTVNNRFGSTSALSSKTAQFFKEKPFSKPFPGDLPPLGPGVLYKKPSSSSRSDADDGNIKRDVIDTSLPSSSSSSFSHTTKLKRVMKK